MKLWPFGSKAEKKLTPEELRTRLIQAAASEPAKKFKDLCHQYREQVAAQIDFFVEIPAALQPDQVARERHVHSIVKIAETLAQECEAPGLWNRLQLLPDFNPLLQCEQWDEDLKPRLDRLEFAELISEARVFAERIKSLPGLPARKAEAKLLIKLAGLLMHSGKIPEAEATFHRALGLYRELQDTDGLRASLFNLMEVQRYFGNNDEAVRFGDELVQLLIQLGMNSEPLKRKVDLLRRGEPALRVVCVRNGVDLEIDEISSVTEKQQELQFRRNRPSLHLAIVRTKEGTTLGSEGKLNEALAKFQEAREIDPFDPDPVYQSAVGYLELGQYAKAREAFDEVERLAPGWFHCRSDRWLAKSLEDGKATEEQFKVLRVLEGGKATAEQAIGALQLMLAKDPTFTPYYLLFGDYLREQKDLNNANLVYRKGLKFAAEPDIESRLLVAAGAILTKETPERAEFLKRAIALNGNLVATATAKLLLLT